MVEWRISDAPVPYPEAVTWMEARVDAIQKGHAEECVWLLEHPSMYTAGTSAKAQDLLTKRFEVHETKRGGQYTYHGPGQRIIYPILDLNRRGRDIRAYVRLLEDWVIATLDAFQIKGEVREGRVGVWVQRPEKPRTATGEIAEDKIAAIGVRVRKWIAFHGISFNVEPDLDHYDGIVPCGIESHGITSLVDLGLPVTVSDLDIVLRREFDRLFAV